MTNSSKLTRQQGHSPSDERIQVLEQKARDLARFVETTRQQTLLQADRKTEALEQKARDLANFVERLRNQTRLQSETEIEALGQQARDLAVSVEVLRKETRLRSEEEIATLGRKARDLAIEVETVREQTLVKVDAEREGHITAKKEAEQNAALLAAIVASSDDAILAKSIDGLITAWNIGAERLFGWTEAEVLGRHISFLVPPDRLDELSGIMKRLRAGERVDHFETVRLNRDGTRIDVSLTISPILNAEGQLIGASKVARDITAKREIGSLKRQASDLAASVEESRIEALLESDRMIRKLNEDLEQRVLERTSELEAANRELEAFSYSVSHDLRAPLRAIDGFSRILLEDEAPSLSDNGKHYLALVRDNTRQMGQLVDDLLAFSRLGRLALTRRTVQPGKMVQLTLAEMQAEQDGRQVEIVVGELPPCQADPTLLKQVWTNLLSNALKYTRKCEVARITIGSRIEAAATGACQETVYFVTDNGAGFNMKYADKLFGVFQRMHRAADYDGTGVGLAIVQRIIQRHGGRVWAEAQVNQGATFSFTLE